MSNRCVKVELIGGVGNQLFQYFAGRALAELHDVPLKLDISLIGINGTKHESSLSALNLSMDFIESPKKVIFRKSFFGRAVAWIFRKTSLSRRFLMFFHRRYESPTLGYDLNLLRVRPPITISGYFQTKKFYDQVIGEDSKRIELKSSSVWFDNMANLLKSKTVVGLHIRRGDYLNLKESFGLLSKGYYFDALRRLKEQLQYEEIWVFSDDTDLAGLVLGDIKGTRYIIPPNDSNPEESMFLMAQCSALIISNSTFAWWAGVINGGNMVCYPKPWFLAAEYSADLLLPEWQAIESSWE